MSIEQVKQKLINKGLYNHPVYGKKFGDAVIRLVETHENENHSAESGKQVIACFNELMKE